MDLIFKTSSLLPKMIKPLKMVHSNRKEFAPRANSFLLELTLLEKGGQKKPGSVAAPECVTIHLNCFVSFYDLMVHG